MAKRKQKSYPWVTWPDDELLDLRFCDLQLVLRNTKLQEYIHQLYEELFRRGIRFKPHCWLAEEWFSPDGVPGIAIPFYLAHRRLAKLEYRQMYEVEGGNSRWCMQLLRHEAGHAIDTAYGLHRRKRWKQLFGSHSRPYPVTYTPNIKSKNYVFHLDWWYAQSHPAEDFAETFAVWLRPRSNWRREYQTWPVIRKLEYVDELMQDISRKKPMNRCRERVERLRENRKTLREHYEEKRAFYGINIPALYDGELKRLFPQIQDANGTRRSAAVFLRKLKPEFIQLCARGVGESPYVIAQILQDMIIRCREMKLYVTRPEEELKIEVAVFISLQTMNYMHNKRHKVPL